MRRLLTAAAFVLALAGAAAGQAAGVGAAQGSGDEHTLLGLTKEWTEAEGGRDRAALERIVGADFEGTGPHGHRVASSEVLPTEGASGGGGGRLR